MIWQTVSPFVDLGRLPEMLSEFDERCARDQFHANYAHGGGWSSFSGFTFNPDTKALTYPGDPPMRPIAGTTLRDETIYLYDSAWVAIVQPDGSYDVARLD